MYKRAALRSVSVQGTASVERKNLHTLASVSHDMRTPLCAIALYNDLLRDAAPDAAERETYHEGIAVQVQRLTDLAHRLTAPTSTQYMCAPPDYKAINIISLLEDTARLHTVLYKSQGYIFDVEVPQTLPYLFADRSALARVLDNLLDNAVKYSEPHRIVMRALGHHRQSCTFVVLEVQDQGPGIPAKHWPYLFNPHYRAGHKGPGTGLGLAIVRELVEKHRGHVEIDNTPGGGTTFRVVLPVKSPAASANTLTMQRHVYKQK